MSKQRQFWDDYERLESNIDYFKMNLRNVKSYIQNDFEKMIESDCISKKQINDSAIDFENECKRLGDLFNSLKAEFERINFDVHDFLKTYT